MKIVAEHWSLWKGMLWGLLSLLIAIVLILLFVAGCSSGRNGSAAAADAVPGTEEFGLSKQGLVEKIEAVEADIAQCMSDAGFEYVAVDYNTVRRGMTSDKSLPGMGERQFIANYGFGISTLYTGAPPQLAELMIPAQIGLGEQNVQIFANLSAADQTAYNRTLFGDHSDATFAVALETEDFSRTGGCTRQAIEANFSQEQMSTSFLSPKDALIEKDPRMVAALGEFSNCLHDAGFDYDSERAVEPDLRRRTFEITNGAPIESLDADALTALKALQTEEMALAAAVITCEETILDPVESQVERELFARQN
ncbi:MAG: hypothetical protein R2911_36965 [Caldilineaceae bacterium]